MNRFFTSLVLLAASVGSALTADAASLPYKSDMGENYGIASDWKVVNKASRAKSWQFDRDNTGYLLDTPGTSAAVCKPYDSEYAANAWLISPEFEFKAGGSYVISVWAKTKGSDDENFKICFGTTDDPSSMTTVLIDKPAFTSPMNYELVSTTFTPEDDVTGHIGIHCYSEANKYVLSLTGFSVSDENGSSDIPEVPEVPETGKELPYDFAFNDQASFDKDWTCGYGEDAGVQSNWQLRTYSGWVVFDVAENKKEDNWLISPLLNFEEAGNYVIVYTGLITGKLEFLLGEGTDDLSGYTVIGTQNVTDSYDNDVKYEMGFTITEPGDYRVAVRACAESGTYMGYRMKNIFVRSDASVPAHVTDLTAVADSNDELSVALCWTNPSVDHKGAPLSSITKIELYRNDELIKDDFMILTPGATNAWLDEPATSGSYSYKVVVYNANGKADGEPASVSAGYVGRPLATLPYSADSSEESDMALFSSVDANNDGVAWEFYKGSSKWYNTMQLAPSEAVEHDDYLISPYIHLTPGYYAFDYTVSCRYNNFEAGYITDRHNPQGTFVKLAEIHDWQEYSSPKGHQMICIEEEGDYALCIHAIGKASNSAYLKMELADMSLKASAKLPTAVTDLAAADTEDGQAVIVSWVNPTLDNAGKPLSDEDALTVTIKRNGDVLAVLTDGDYATPGAICRYTDLIENGGEYTYSVTVANANGAAEGRAPEVSLFAGPTPELPYEVSDFSEWFIDDSSYYCWDIDEETHFAKWSASWAWSPIYTVFSPFLNLEEGAEYTLEATFDGNPDAEQGMRLVSCAKVSESDATVHHNFTLPSGAEDHTLSLVLAAANAAAPALLAEEGDEAAESEKVSIPAGKRVLGFRPSAAGKVTLKAFRLSKASTTGVTTVIAAEGALVYNSGIVSCAGASEIVVCDAAGRVLRAVKGSEADLRDLRGTGMVIVSAPGFGALKLAL